MTCRSLALVGRQTTDNRRRPGGFFSALQVICGFEKQENVLIRALICGLYPRISSVLSIVKTIISIACRAVIEFANGFLPAGYAGRGRQKGRSGDPRSGLSVKVMIEVGAYLLRSKPPPPP
jgi:hypothetical protein